MNERIMQFRIGIFVLVAGIVLAILVVWFGEIPTLGQGRDNVYVRFENTPNVAEGTPVRMSGIRIGEVSRVRLDNRPEGKDHPQGGVILTLAINRQYRDFLRTDSRPRIGSNLLGDSWIEFSPGTSNQRLAVNNPQDIIPGETGADPMKMMADLATRLESFQAMANQWTKTGADVDHLVQENRPRLTTLLDRSQDTMASLKQTSDTANGILDDPKVQKDFKQAVASINDIVSDPANQLNLRKTLNNFQVSSGKLPATLDKLFDTVNTMQESIAPLQDVTKTLNARTGPLLDKLDQSLTGFNTVSGNLEDFTNLLNNSNGSLRMLITSANLYNDADRMLNGFIELSRSGQALMENLNRFARRVANDPSAMTRGVLERSR